MARIEKTVFISYRRKDISWALAVYQYLASQKYDVFFDYTHIPSGDFEQIIVSNIKARAHFVLILTPTTLDRCSDPGDWVRREIETAMDEKRNIVPLFFDGFSFGSPGVAEKLTGKLSDVKRYNGLDIPSGYFPEAMERLSTRYLNVPLSAVLHPVSIEVKKVVKEEKNAANKALVEQKQEIKELVKPVKEKTEKPKQAPVKEATESPSPFRRGDRGEVKWQSYALGAGILLIAALGIVGINSLIQNAGQRETPSPTPTTERTITLIPKPTNTRVSATSTATDIPSSPTPELGIGSTMTGADGMTLLYVPAGEFTMGSEDGEAVEKPVHTVYLDAFWIDQTEVTNAMYTKCVEDGRCTKQYYLYYGHPEYDNYPVVSVTWKDANVYCSWASRRLPTEAEWEKAASWDETNRQKYVYPWGSSIDCSFANYSLDCVGDISLVSSYPNGVSPYGVLDMAGNVSEWVSSLYQLYPYIATDGREDLSDSSNDRVWRGGGWNTGEEETVRTTFRIKADPRWKLLNVGFRCAMDASE